MTGSSTADPLPSGGGSAPPRRRRRALRILAGVFAFVLLLLAGGAASLWWVLRSDRGTAWMLAQLPGVEVVRPRGALIGDFGADALVVRFGDGGELRLAQLAWQGLAVRRSEAASAWMLVQFDRLSVAQIQLAMPKPTQTSPSAPPQHLQLPVELVVQSLHVGELRAGPLGDEPLRDLRAHIHLGDQRGAQHRVDALALARGPLQLHGHVRVAAEAPMPADIQVDLRQAAVADWPAWNAQLSLVGPLARAALSARLQADTAPAQALTLNATLQPFAEWPLDGLDAKAADLDVSALLAGGPRTALNGEIALRAASVEQLDARIDLSNAQAGAWDAGRVPVRQLQLRLLADPRDRTQARLQTLQVELGSAHEAAGRVTGAGGWTGNGWTLDATLQGVRPERLDARAPAMAVDGIVRSAGQGFGASPAQPAAARVIDVTAELEGRLLDRAAAPPLALALQGAWRTEADTQALELRQLRASSAGSQATLQGRAQRDAASAPWRAEGRMSMADFDLRPWVPGPADTPLRRAPSRLSAHADFEFTLPEAGPTAAIEAWLASWVGAANLRVEPSVLAGMPVKGNAQLRGSGGDDGLSAALQVDAANNVVSAKGRFARDPARDHWEATIAAPALDRLAALAPLSKAPARGTRPAVAGAARGRLVADGRWPRLHTHGDLVAERLVWPGMRLRQADARWRLGTAPGAQADVTVTLNDLALPDGQQVRDVPAIVLRLDGTAEAHRLDLQATVAAAPPKAVEALEAATPTDPRPPAGGPRTLAHLRAQGGLQHTPGAANSAAGAAIAGWRGRIETLDLRRADASQALVKAADVAIDLRTPDTQPVSLQVQPGRADVLGGVLRWSRLSWQAGQGQAPALVDADVTLEPIGVAPLLARLQPEFGWSGDLEIGARAVLRTTPALHVDVLLQRHRGDLRMAAAGAAPRALGLTELRLAARADGTAWRVQAGFASRATGSASADVTARTDRADAWPAANTPMQGALALRVPDLGIYNAWLPVGWRLGGQLEADARLAGTLGAPQYTGSVRGSQLAVSNFVEGVRVRDGELQVSLRGDDARIERFVAHAGDGVLRVEGGAQFGAQPTAQVSVSAERFRALGRVDRRIDLSGRAQLRLDAQRVALQGGFQVDEGLIDLGRSEAPELSQDVVVVDDPAERRKAVAAAPGSARTKPSREVQMDLRLDLGHALRVTGKGINTLLAGDLRITAPGGQLAAAGAVRTVKGNFDAYAQKLRIDRGVISFSGPVANPRLDIEATRPDLKEVSVGVAITGTASNPQVRLFSTPEMSELDKLSWLTMGRASAGLATDQTALLQRAAMAIFAGQRGGGGGVAKRLGLDALSVQRGESGGVQDAVVTLGKQVSERFYVGYQQSLDATGGGFELIYRIAQRFKVRVQTGATTAVDVVMTWLWG